MNAILLWMEERTGAVSALARCRRIEVPGGASLAHVWPRTLAFAFALQLISGLFLWMLYSPSTQTAWESVYWLQYHVPGGWLLRGIHHHAGQIVLVLIGIYLLQMLLTGKYRAPRELAFVTVVLMGLVTLGLHLTGDLLAWDQNSRSSTEVRTNFLTLLPVVGSGLNRVAIGGPSFGHLTLTRFTALHVGLLTGIFGGLLWGHHRLVKRALERENAGARRRASPYWPHQAILDAAACAVVSLVVLALALVRGAELGAPADPAEFYDAARPEWAFLGLYGFSELFPGNLKLLPIFVIPGAAVLVVLAMPFIGRSKLGHCFNIAFVLVVLAGLTVFSFQVLAQDAANEHFLASLEQGERDAERVKLLAEAKGIPVGGAVALLRNDPKTQGPKLYRQHCASCHSHADTEGRGIVAEEPSAPNLYDYASPEWIAGFLDPERIVSEDYFGNTAFRTGEMVQFVRDLHRHVDDLLLDEIEAITIALSAEAELPARRDAEADLQKRIAEGRDLIVAECASCHRFHDQGSLGFAPDLTGYGSREWTVAITANPEHPRFYGDSNDRMPAYAEHPDEPEKNLLTMHQIELITDWLRGDWFEPGDREQDEQVEPDEEDEDDVDDEE